MCGMRICMWLCALCLCALIQSSGWKTQLSKSPPAPNIATVCIPPMITHTLTRAQREGEGESPEKKAFSGFLICIKPVCMSGNIRFYYTPALHAWATHALACVAWFMARRKAPIDAGCCESVSVNSGSPSKRRGHTQHRASNEEPGQEKLHSATDSTHFYPLSSLSLSSIFSLLFFYLPRL